MITTALASLQWCCPASTTRFVGYQPIDNDSTRHTKFESSRSSPQHEIFACLFAMDPSGHFGAAFTLFASMCVCLSQAPVFCCATLYIQDRWMTKTTRTMLMLEFVLWFSLKFARLNQKLAASSAVLRGEKERAPHARSLVVGGVASYRNDR